MCLSLFLQDSSFFQQPFWRKLRVTLRSSCVTLAICSRAAGRLAAGYFWDVWHRTLWFFGSRRGWLIFWLLEIKYSRRWLEIPKNPKNIRGVQTAICFGAWNWGVNIGGSGVKPCFGVRSLRDSDCNAIKQAVTEYEVADRRYEPLKPEAVYMITVESCPWRSTR